MRKVVGQRNEYIYLQLVVGIVCCILSIVGMRSYENEAESLMLILLMMGVGLTLWPIILLIILPRDLVIIEGDIITVFVRRNKSVSFKASEIEDTDVFTWGRGKVNASMTFILKDKREIVASHVSNTDEIYNELLKLSKRNVE